MKVILDAALFDLPHTQAFELLSLIYLGYEGRHSMTTDPLDDERISVWLDARGQVESMCCRLAFDSGIKEFSRALSNFYVRVCPGEFPAHLRQNELILGMSDAMALLRSPFRILLEDETRDGNFLLALAQPEWRDLLQDMRSKVWVRFEHGGGVVRMLETLQTSAQSLLSRVGIWVLFDSDSLAPSRPSQQVIDLMDLCGRNIPFHCLERRSVENYVPLLALEYWANHDQRNRIETRTQVFRAFRSMSEPCRYHYNLKNGFNGDRARLDRENVGNLYHCVSIQDQQTLADGFASRIANLFERYTWANWEWWMGAGPEREEGGRVIQALFSRL